MADSIDLPAFGDVDPAGPVPGGIPSPGPSQTGWRLPHHTTFAAIWQQATRTYWYRHDEALRKSYADALAMRRDQVIHACLRRRQLPTSAIPHAIEPEDPTDPRQRIAARVVGRLIDRVPRFQHLKMSLLEAIFFGRAGVQVRFGPMRIDGIDLVGVKDHRPVNGDKIVRNWKGVPGVLVNGAWAARQDRDGPDPKVRKHLRLSGHFGWALWLETKGLRDSFIIHVFEPTDTDYLYEGDLAGAVHGLGLRSRLWLPWNLRNEVASWSLDALQKIGANGLLYSRFPHGSEDYADKVLEALGKLTSEHLAAVPFVPGQSGDEDPIRSIPVNAVGYEILATFQNLYEGHIREVINGDSPSYMPSADTRKSAELTEDTRISLLRADAVNLQETLTDQLVQPLVRRNREQIEALTGGPVDYRLRMKLQIDRPNAVEDLQAAQLLVGIFSAMGVQNFPVDPAHLIDLAGLRPPEGGTIGQEIERIMAEQQGMAVPPPQPGMIPANQGLAPEQPGMGGPPGPEQAPQARMPEGEAPADGTPPDLLQNLAQPTTNQGGSPDQYGSSRRLERYSLLDQPRPSQPQSPEPPQPNAPRQTRGQRRLARADAEISRQRQKAEGLKEYQQKGTEAPKFKQWFEGSAVVDESGKPKDVFHGTARKNWTRFDPEKERGTNFLGPGLYFSEDEDVAADYSHRPDRAAKELASKFSVSGELGDEQKKAIADLAYEKSGGGMFGVDSGEIEDAERAPSAYLARKIAAGDRDFEAIASRHGIAIKRPPYGRGVHSARLNIRNPFDFDSGKIRTSGRAVDLASAAFPESDDVSSKMASEIERADLGGEGLSYRNLFESAFLSLGGRPGPDGRIAFGAGANEDIGRLSDAKAAVNRMLRSLGYDGITAARKHRGSITMDEGRPYREWVAFEPNQIKSKANFGTFDPESEHIHHADEDAEIERYSLPDPPERPRSRTRRRRDRESHGKLE